MPNRRAHDHIGQFQAAGIRQNDINVIITNMERAVDSGLSLKNLEAVAQKIIKDSSFRERFIKNPSSALGQLGYPIGHTISLVIKLLLIVIPIAVFSIILGVAYLAPGSIPPGNILFPHEIMGPFGPETSMSQILAQGLVNGVIYGGLISGIEFIVLKLTSTATLT